MDDLFGGPTVAPESSLDSLVALHMDIAEEATPAFLSERGGEMPFEAFAVAMMQGLMLRETKIKDVCVALAQRGIIHDTWSLERKRKPSGLHPIWLEKKELLPTDGMILPSLTPPPPRDAARTNAAPAGRRWPKPAAWEGCRATNWLP